VGKGKREGRGKGSFGGLARGSFRAQKVLRLAKRKKKELIEEEEVNRQAEAVHSDRLRRQGRTCEKKGIVKTKKRTLPPKIGEAGGLVPKGTKARRHLNWLARKPRHKKER